jgi:uncharacterized protein (TIGR03435 family)
MGNRRRLIGMRCAFLLVPAAIAAAQSQTARPAFEVASVKTSSQTWMQIAPQRSGGRITWTADLWYMIGYAYRLPVWRISGPIPGSDHLYSVAVTMDPGATDDQVRDMFQTLLADRFQMAAHKASKEANGYALTTGPRVKLREAKPDGPAPPLPAWFRAADAPALEGKVVATMESATIGAITGRGVTMAQLCQSMERVLRTFVTDETGLTGKYYFALRFARDDAPAGVDAPTLAAALQQELGLKLEKKRGPVETLAVDRIAVTPTEN